MSKPLKAFTMFHHDKPTVTYYLEKHGWYTYHCNKANYPQMFGIIILIYTDAKRSKELRNVNLGGCEHSWSLSHMQTRKWSDDSSSISWIYKSIFFFCLSSVYES